MSGFSDEQIERYFDIIQPLIEYCITCQPYEGGEAFWILGDKENLEELFNEYEVPEDMREDLATSLKCHYCGRQLERYDDIGLKTEEEKEADRKWLEWDGKYYYKVKEFGDYLEKYPYLGLNHEIGKKIHYSIKNFPQTMIEDEIWWRGRKPKKSEKMSCSNMSPPEFPKKEGRFNHYGQRTFYLASTKEAVAKEILSQNECLIWTQEFRVKNISKLLDLSDRVRWDDEYSVLVLGLIDVALDKMVPKEGSPWKPEYFIPRFIADCAKNEGFEGIKFRSKKHYDDNLVLFRWNDESLIPQNEPTILNFKRVRSDDDIEI